MINSGAITADIRTILGILLLALAGWIIWMGRKGKFGDALGAVGIMLLALIPVGLAALIGTGAGQALGSRILGWFINVS